MTNILGISAFYHDSAAAIIVDGVVVAAAQEERFTRVKHDASFPENAIESCLEQAGIAIQDIDYVAFYEKPFLKFERILETHFAHAPFGSQAFLRTIPVWLRSKLYLSRVIRKGLKNQYQNRIVFPEHHESHAASAFFASPFEEAAILTLDGVGEWATTTLGFGRGNQIKLEQEIQFPDSLGLLYAAFTSFCGFKVNGGEGKLMGLASYGKPIYTEKILKYFIDVKNDGSFRMNQGCFNYCIGSTMPKVIDFGAILGASQRVPESEITQQHMDLAASIQSVTELILLRIASHAFAKSKAKNLCIAGGVGLNCVANGKLLKESPFENVWVQPAAGDSGGATGAALFVWHQLLENPRKPMPFQTPFLGPGLSEHPVDSLFTETNIRSAGNFEHFDELAEAVAEMLESGKIVGWMQGRMEFGPRALGNRSILASPLIDSMKDDLNERIKFRESFRPFAPVVLAESCSEYFDLKAESPFMTFAADVLDSARDSIPAVTHVDQTARVQTVTKEQNERLYELIKKFESRTGHPVLLNTSFNVRGEPIVCTEKDAVECLFKTGLDAIVIGDLLIKKEDQRELNFDQHHHQENVQSLISKFTGLMHRLTFPIRWLVSTAVLTIIYFIIVTPVGVIWRLMSRRAYARRAKQLSKDKRPESSFPPMDFECESYWKDRPDSPDKSRYLKQY